jgi:hypothetical protein
LGIALISIGETVVADDGVQLSLGDVAEGRMAEVVGEGGGFDDIRVETASGLGDPPVPRLQEQVLGETVSDLGDFQRVGQPVVGWVLLSRGDDLGNPAKAAKGGAVQNPVAIPAGRGALIAASRVGAMASLRLVLPVGAASHEQSIVIAVSSGS